MPCIQEGILCPQNTRNTSKQQQLRKRFYTITQRRQINGWKDFRNWKNYNWNVRKLATKRKKKRIWEFSKQNGEPENKKILNVAKEDFFYPQWLEEWFQKNPETFGLKSLNKIIHTQTVEHLSRKDKERILEWIIVQNERTLERRNSIKQGHKDLFKRLKEDLINIDDSTDYVPSMQIINLFKYFGLIPSLINFKWILLENYSSIPFFTSDAPVIQYNPIDELENRNKLVKNGCGYLSKGVALYLPLNTNYSLLLQNSSDNSFFDDYIIDLGSKWKLKEENINYYNAKLIFHSNKYLFSNQDDFSYCVEILNKNPEYREENRKRWEII